MNVQILNQAATGDGALASGSRAITTVPALLERSAGCHRGIAPLSICEVIPDRFLLMRTKERGMNVETISADFGVLGKRSQRK
jgi:hypothetical protein